MIENSINEEYNEDYNDECNECDINPANYSSYNCGGYALQTYTWLTPYIPEWSNLDYPEDIWDEHSRDNYIVEMARTHTEKEAANLVLKRDLDFMLRTFNLKVIPEMLVPKFSNVIAYRLFIKGVEDTIACIWDVDTDFHFRVKRNGTWMEKMGSGTPRECVFTREPWRASSCTYDSDIVYLVWTVDYNKFKKENCNAVSSR